MDISINNLQDYFKIGYDAFEDSREEAAEVLNFFHNRQYSSSQLAILTNRGQPAETFNVIKLFGRLILGYYSTVVNTVKVSPEQYADVLTSSLLNDVVDYEMRTNFFETEGDKIKLDGILQGLMCVFVDVKDTGKKDPFGRKLKKIGLSHVPAEEIVLDPLSKLEDYSDARWLHRFKWVSEEQLKELVEEMADGNVEKTKFKDIKDQLDAYDNHLNIDEGEFEYRYNNQFQGHYKMYNNYLVVHTIIEDDDGERWSIFWSGDKIISKNKITHKEVKFPYRVHKVHTSNKTEYYGLFREVIESQKAINQAVLKIQLMANTQKVFVENKGVEDISKFTDQINRVNAVIQVKSLKKIKVENITREVLDQYTIIDRALDRIQRTLGVNDSFLGMASASDSGRKVKLQQQATIIALRYITVRLEQFYRLLGWDMVNLIKQYYTAYQALRIVDDTVGERWAEINKPMMEWTGQMDANNQPVMQPVFDEVLDPATDEPMTDEDGRIIIAPVATEESEIAFTDVDVNIDTVIYNDEDEKNQLMIENMLAGPLGNMLSQANPAGFLKAGSLVTKSMKTKHSLDISQILDETAHMIMNQGNVPPPETSGEGSTKAKDAKLPTNTNEGL